MCAAITRNSARKPMISVVGVSQRLCNLLVVKPCTDLLAGRLQPAIVFILKIVKK